MVVESRFSQKLFCYRTLESNLDKVTLFINNAASKNSTKYDLVSHLYYYLLFFLTIKFNNGQITVTPS